MQKTSVLAGMILVLTAAPACRAGLRAPYETETVVGRSDAIVVAAVEAGTVEYVPHAPDTFGGRSWEHHLTLRVSDVIKGECRTAKIPAVLDYGLDPSTTGQADHGPTSRLVTTTVPLAIEDTGNSKRSLKPVLADATADNVWLLRIGQDGRYHVSDPEDLQPLALKDYVACYLSADPEHAVRALIQRQPTIAADGARYLRHLDVQRILKEPDPAIRAERLLPYYLARQRWGLHDEPGEGLAACGPAAGPYLLGAYQSTWDADLQYALILLMGRVGYAGATDVLIGVLDDGDRFWAAQTLKPGWWNADVDSSLTKARREQYGRVYAAVWTLGKIGDGRARPAIDATRRRWAAIGFENPQIVEACDHALATQAASHGR